MQKPAYPCSGCGSGCGLLTAQNGTFSDGSGLSGYANGAYCEWVIAPAQASVITLRFAELSTQAGTDFIRVFQCTDAACSDQQQLVELSGLYSAPQVLSSSTGFMKVVFTSDKSVNYDGFNASWTSVSYLALHVYKRLVVM